MGEQYKKLYDHQHQLMEIPQSGSRDLDYLFEFSPDQGSGEAKKVFYPVSTTQEFEATDISKKKIKFYSEMKTTHKLEKSRQSARECRARKKLRYQYLDDLILERERANERLRGEISKFVTWCSMMDQNNVPEGMQEFLNNIGNEEPQS